MQKESVYCTFSPCISARRLQKTKKKRGKGGANDSDSDWSAEEEAKEELKSNAAEMSESSSSAESASDEEGWDEVEMPAPVKKRAKTTVEVTIDRKESAKAKKEREDQEREARIEREKAAALLIEDRHKLHFLGYVAHLRYLAVCCRDVLKDGVTTKSKKSSKKLFLVDLKKSDDLAADLAEFVESFEKDAKLQDAYKSEKLVAHKRDSIDRLKQVLTDKKFGNMRDLAMVGDFLQRL